MHDRERDEKQEALEILEAESARQEEELARTEEEIARRKETPTPPTLSDDDNNDEEDGTEPVVIIILDPTIESPAKCTKRGCFNKKWCTFVDAECNTTVFKFGCPGCGLTYDCESSCKQHIKGRYSTEADGCLRYGVKYASHCQLIEYEEFVMFKLLKLDYEPKKIQLDIDGKAMRTQLMSMEQVKDCKKEDLKLLVAGWV
mmetsp:Transcript_9463/g.10990  ORF Transcript_9463/g.10990 Transcript_9463/m.10990 type:complete len:201 (-) Transcript_9463:160-762(-)